LDDQEVDEQLDPQARRIERLKIDWKALECLGKKETGSGVSVVNEFEIENDQVLENPKDDFR
jgi:hypothetical protein